MTPEVTSALIGAVVVGGGWLANRLVGEGRRQQVQVYMESAQKETAIRLTKQDEKLEVIERLTREGRDAVREQNGNVRAVTERTAQLDKRLAVVESILPEIVTPKKSKR